ncbi:zf-TFIIB domain-containing protein [Cupriavidus sp. AU9028]|uniref:TFIIB-type zinc ribbon-containing protein n=1 Tax=Cupriavidus sp. AU9028 TaxID=2871157 RepID=UPI001C978D2E|nr:zf-TFIIB domain-containing protein [Cupriavidus sp. AU9028]MBY4896625.1 zf-TFIIB domain-containing protein [Cupriavidus sp. AU9028]
MDCPVCPQTTLVMSERQGVEIDYCPKCRGVWLDRGELDKILERAAAEQAPVAQAAPNQAPAQPAARPYDPGHGGGYRGDDRYRNDDRYREQKHYRKKSIWHELFD